MTKPDTAQANLIKHLPADIQSSEVIRSFLEDPLSTLAATIASALAYGHKDLTLAGGRITQAIIQGRAAKQFGQELDELFKKGKIRHNFGETKYGFPSFVELMKTIDSDDATDEDKLRAAKTMFVALNSPDAPKNEDSLRYQLFRIVLLLSGPQVRMLSACRTLFLKKQYDENSSNDAKHWFSAISSLMGHNVVALMEQDESTLIKYGILTDRHGPDRSSISQVRTARLTDLGVKISDLIEQYDSAIPKS
jgi:hypothetical protein